MVENGGEHCVLGLAFRILQLVDLARRMTSFLISRRVEEFQLLYFYISFSNEVHFKLVVLSFWLFGSGDLVGQ